MLLAPCAGSGMTMRTCLQLLQSIAKEAAAAQGAGATAAAMVKGAQKYLEQGHTSYMQRAIQADRAQVWPLLWHFSPALMRCQLPRRRRLCDCVCCQSHDEQSF